MTDQEFAPILEAVIARTKHEVLRERCAVSNPKHEKFRRSVLMIYRGESEAGTPSEPMKPLTLEEAMQGWYADSVSLVRRCCKQAPDRKRFDARVDIPLDEQRWWPF